jgi:hypothetical protein
MDTAPPRLISAADSSATSGALPALELRRFTIGCDGSPASPLPYGGRWSPSAMARTPRRPGSPGAPFHGNAAAAEEAAALLAQLTPDDLVDPEPPSNELLESAQKARARALADRAAHNTVAKADARREQYLEHIGFRLKATVAPAERLARGQYNKEVHRSEEYVRRAEQIEVRCHATALIGIGRQTLPVIAHRIFQSGRVLSHPNSTLTGNRDLQRPSCRRRRRRTRKASAPHTGASARRRRLRCWAASASRSAACRASRGAARGSSTASSSSAATPIASSGNVERRSSSVAPARA